MVTCDDIREVLLDLLYELVDAPQARELQGHVAGCSACQAALEEAKRQQNLFARAAHLYKEVPLFVAPKESPAVTTPATHEEPAVIPMPGARTRRRHWAMWAAAAAMLLAAAG